MNVIMQAKVETCLELSTSALDFRKKVFKVTGWSAQGFKNNNLAWASFERLVAGDKKEVILRELF